MAGNIRYMEARAGVSVISLIVPIVRMSGASRWIVLSRDT